MANYPRALPNTYTLSRLKAAWSANSLPPAFRVAGRLAIMGSDGMRLISPEGELHLVDLQSDSLAIGDWVTVEVERKNIKPTSRGFSVQNASQVHLTVKAQREGVANKMRSDVHESWMNFQQEVRDHLQSLGLSEVTTPSLVTCPGMEPHLEPMSVEVKQGSRRENLFLPTSPELHLKKLLSQGWSDIFELKWCYRNEEQSPVHQAEFLMLEWYRAFADLSLIRADLLNLLSHLAEKGWVKDAASMSVKECTMRDLFLEYVNIDLQPDTPRETLLARAQELDLPVGDSDWDDLFHWLFVSQVEPQLHQMGAVIVKDYPPSQAALARFTNDGWADRFEFYWDGLEIANAFHELNDPEEQRRRFENDILTRAQKERTAVPVDEEFMKCLEAGMPPSGGIALGLERLFMACCGIQQISELRFFPRS